MILWLCSAEWFFWWSHLAPLISCSHQAAPLGLAGIRQPLPPLVGPWYRLRVEPLSSIVSPFSSVAWASWPGGRTIYGAESTGCKVTSSMEKSLLPCATWSKQVTRWARTRGLEQQSHTAQGPAGWKEQTFYDSGERGDILGTTLMGNRETGKEKVGLTGMCNLWVCTPLRSWAKGQEYPTEELFTLQMKWTFHEP